MGVEDSEMHSGSICSDQPSARQEDKKNAAFSGKPESKKKGTSFLVPSQVWPGEGSQPLRCAAPTPTSSLSAEISE